MKQALAAIGQSKIMSFYNNFFRGLGESCAQVLITYENLGVRSQFLNARNTFKALFQLGVVPIVNENDTVAVEELRFGDNDCLSAMVAAMLSAKHLIILTDVDGLYTANPAVDAKARRIPVVRDFAALDADTSSKGSGLGTGGMATKVTAARLATASGVACSIVGAKDPNVIRRVLKGESVGTLFIARKLKSCKKSKKRWIAGLPARQFLLLDAGAVSAVKKKSNLYAAGIISVKGKFTAHTAVGLCDSKGILFAQGIVNFTSQEINLLKGKQMKDMEKVLGYYGTEKVMHRANIVLLQFIDTEGKGEGKFETIDSPTDEFGSFSPPGTP